MPPAAVPGVEQSGETVVSEARDLPQHWQPQQVAEPDIAGGTPPDFVRPMAANVEQPSGFITLGRRPSFFIPSTEANEGIGSKFMSRNFVAPARPARTRRLFCRSMPPLQTG